MNYKRAQLQPQRARNVPGSTRAPRVVFAKPRFGRLAENSGRTEIVLAFLAMSRATAEHGVGVLPGQGTAREKFAG